MRDAPWAYARLSLFTTPDRAESIAELLLPSSCSPFLGSDVSWLLLSLFWWSAALWTGVSLVSIAPWRGMAACATLAVAGEALLIVFGVTALWGDGWSSEFFLFYATGVVVGAPLLVGGAIARRRMLACGFPMLRQGR